MSAHSILAPSSASRWVRCPGSVLAQMAVPPEPESEAAREGTLVHELAARLIDDACRGLLPERWRDVPHSAYRTDDMARAAHGYALEVFKVLQTLRIFGGPHMGIEDRLEIPSISEHCFGTTDAWVYSQEHDQLIIWDLKYGFRVVEPVDNWQLICYVIGIADRLGYFNPETKVQIRIYQPRASHRLGISRKWKTTWGEINRFQAMSLEASAREALSDNPQTIVGHYCRYCRARHTCSALSLEAASAAEYVSTPMPQELGGQGLAVELAILEAAQKLLEYRLTAIQEQAIQRIRAGGTVPGYQIGHGWGSVVWTVCDEDVINWAEASGINGHKGVITPKQALDAGMNPDIVKNISKHKPGKQTLRPVDTTAARMVFGGQDDSI